MALKWCSALLVGLAVACGGGESSPASVPTEAVDVSTIPAFTLNGCTPRVPELQGHGRCDPVNLVFPGATVEVVTSALIRESWTLTGIGTLQVVLAPGRTQGVPQAVQLFNADGSSIAPTRYHIRLWQVPAGLLVGAVHHESTAANDQIDRDWEHAEAYVRDQLCKEQTNCEDSGLMEEQRTQQRGSDRWRGFQNDATPSIIRLPSGD